jgi:hypothetical protein
MVRRTKQQKQKAQEHRSQITYSFESTSKVAEKKGAVPPQNARPAEKLKSNPKEFKVQDMFSYDIRLIYRDLGKTTLISTFILILLGVIAWNLK